MTAVNLGYNPAFVDKHNWLIAAMNGTQTMGGILGGAISFSPSLPRMHTIREVLGAPADISTTGLVICIMVGHEKVADSMWPLIFITQYEAANAQDVKVPQRAVTALGNG